MTGANENLPETFETEAPQQFQRAQPNRIPQYRRDLYPTNLVLSADDLKAFCELLAEANERAKVIEYNRLDLSTFESPQQARRSVNEVMQLEYEYIAQNGDSVQGLGIPRTDEPTFPDSLKSLFVSNSTFPKRSVDVRPFNIVDALLGFEKPSLKIDFQTLPSNPTLNRSQINVMGRDEDWVISTTERIQEFFKKRKAIRPVIHGSGTYDYFLYIAFIPAWIWLLYKHGQIISDWIEDKSVFFNVLIGIYAFLLALLLARFLFQYVRWLLPPMEYYKRSRVGAFVHRGIAGLVGSAILLNAAYDLVKWLVLFFWLS